MIKFHPRASQFIKMRRLVGLASVTLENLLPNIVSKDEKDVGSLGGLWAGRYCYYQQKDSNYWHDQRLGQRRVTGTAIITHCSLIPVFVVTKPIFPATTDYGLKTLAFRQMNLVIRRSYPSLAPHLTMHIFQFFLQNMVLKIH
jgi:hypothetical protein